MSDFRKGRIKVQGNPNCVRDGMIEKTGHWGIYRYDAKGQPGNWSVGHILSGRLMVDKLKRADAERLATMLGDEVLETFVEGKPSEEFQSQTIKTLGKFNKDLVPARLKHLLKGKGK